MAPSGAGRGRSVAGIAEVLARGGDSRIAIAVLDGPVDLAHPCFNGAKLTVLDGPRPSVGNGPALAHGTHVASIIFGQPESPVEGIAPGCRGIVVPVFADGGEDGLACSQLDLARAILTALENGAHIINISGGQLTASGEADPLLAQAIESCARRKVLIVAAAGNDGCECLHAPAAAPSVLAVGAMDAEGAPLASSNWGPAYRSQGILAPGQDVLGAAPGGGTARRSGTSYAAPFVSAQAGLLASLQLALGRPADPHAIREALLKSATPCVPGDAEDCRKFLAGRINIPGAINALAGGNVMTETEQMPPLGLIAHEPGSEAIRSLARAARPDASIRPSGEAGDETPGTMEFEAARPAAAGLDAQVLPSDCGCGCGGKGKSGNDGEKCACGGGGTCSCGGKNKKPALVYALGRLGIDFGSEARRDSFLQAMSVRPIDAPIEAAVPVDFSERLLAHLDENPYEAPSLIWTLNLDATPIYAIQPIGAYAEAAYDRLREALRAQINEGVELISVPGIIGGQVRLQSGQVVPLIVPAIRGMYSWSTEPLVQHVLGAMPEAEAERETYERQSAGLSNFLSRVYYDLRNLGITGEERALNYSATNAVQIAAVIRSTTRDELDLDTIAVKKSPVCRPDSDCYDVELAFFNPANTNVADRVYRFTVDVSDVVPVTIGTVRSWTRRA